MDSNIRNDETMVGERVGGDWFAGTINSNSGKDEKGASRHLLYWFARLS